MATSGRPRAISLAKDEETGKTIAHVSMPTIFAAIGSAVAVIGWLIGVAQGWVQWETENAEKADIKAHDAAPSAHLVVLQDHDGHPTPPQPIATVVKIHDKAIKEMPAQLEAVKEQAGETHEIVITVKNGFYDQRAEEFGRRAVDKMPEGTSRRRLAERYEQVKDSARDNLESGKPIHKGMEAVVF